MKCLFDIFTALSKRHRFFKIRNSSNSFRFIFFSNITFAGYFQDLCIPHIHLVAGKIRHPKHIVIRMHCIVRNIILDQLQNPAAGKIKIIYLFNR